MELIINSFLGSMHKGRGHKNQYGKDSEEKEYQLSPGTKPITQERKRTDNEFGSYAVC